MVDDAGVPPLPRRVPGASDSPKPAVRIDPSAIPEDLRQRVLTAIAQELKRDEAERLLAEERDGDVGQEISVGAGLAKGDVAGPANGGGVDSANGKAREPGQPELAQHDAAFGDAARAGAADVWAAGGDAAAPGAGGAPGHEQAATSPDRPAVLPRRAPGTHGAPPPPAELRREFLPPSLLGLRLDPEAYTEPFPRISAPRPDVPAATDGPRSGAPPAIPGVPAPPAAGLAPPDPAEGAPPEPEGSVFVRSRPTPPWAAPDAAAALDTAAGPDVAAGPDAAAELDGAEPAGTDSPDLVPPPAPVTDIALASAPTATVPAPDWAVPELAVPPEPAVPPTQALPPELAVPPKQAVPLDLASAPTMPAPLDMLPPRPASPAAPKPPLPGFTWPPDPGPPDRGARPVAPASPPPKAGRKPRRPARRWRIFGVFLAVAALVAAAVIALLMSGRPAGGHHTGQGAQARAAAAAVRDRAAAWVAGQVSRAAVVACDPVTCQTLQAHGIPAADLYSLGPRATSPLRSQIVVATAAVRERFGNLLATVYAPAVLATFGSGADRIDIRQTAPQGAAAYRASLSAGVASRKASGHELLRGGRVAAAAIARRQLAAGEVDARLLAAIAQMAAAHPMFIVDFGSPAPGAAPGMPLRQADLAEDAHVHHRAGHTVSAGYVRSMVTFLRSQRGEFRPSQVRTVRLAGGTPVLRVQFTAPSPLGMLGPHT